MGMSRGLKIFEKKNETELSNFFFSFFVCLLVCSLNYETEAMNGLNIFETGLFKIANEIILLVGFFFFFFFFFLPDTTKTETPR